MKKGFLFVVAILLVSTLVAAQTPGNTVSNNLISVLNGAGKVIEYVFGLGFLPGAALNIKLQVITRIAIFLLVFIVAFEGASKAGVSSRSAKVAGLVIAMLCSFSIGPDTLIAISGVYGMLVTFILLLLPIIALGALALYLPSDTKPQIGMKIIILIAVIALASTQAEILDKQATNYAMPAELQRGLGPISGGVVVDYPVYYYPPQYPPRYVPYGGYHG